MDKSTEALQKFLYKEVKQASYRFVLTCMENLKKDVLHEQVQIFVEDFKRLFELCRESDEQVCFVQIALLRSRALMHRPFYRLEAFSKEFYLAEPIAFMDLRMDWLYHPYEEFCREVERESKKYLYISAPELDAIKQIELINSRRIVRHLFEEAILHIVDTEEYQNLGVEDGFQIHMAEYRGPYEKIYEECESARIVGEICRGIL